MNKLLLAVGFALAGIALWAGWTPWRPLLVSVTVFSLILTLLDWRSAYAGAIVNAAILGVALLAPELSLAR